jgi:RHS repeat-associated protein
VWRWDQAEPFGNNVPDENPSGLGAFDLPLRLPSQYFDKETLLHYNYFRDCYDPGTGRFCQPDPMEVRGLVALQGLSSPASGGVNDAEASPAEFAFELSLTPALPAARSLNLYGYVDGDPVKRSDPLGLWSVTLQFYGGWGGGVVFGRNPNGSGFFSLRYGYGIGGGLSYNPLGQRPGYRKNTSPPPGCPPVGVGLGAFGFAGYNFGPANVGVAGAAGANFNFAGPGPFFNPYAGPTPHVNVRGGFGLGVGTAAGGQLTIY